jgi:hypothetical protein
VQYPNLVLHKVPRTVLTADSLMSLWAVRRRVGRLIALTKAARSTINARRHLTSSSIGRLSGQTPFEPGELIDDCLLNLLDRLLRVGRTHLSLSNALLGIR